MPQYCEKITISKTNIPSTTVSLAGNTMLYQQKFEFVLLL